MCFSSYSSKRVLVSCIHCFILQPPHGGTRALWAVWGTKGKAKHHEQGRGKVHVDIIPSDRTWDLLSANATRKSSNPLVFSETPLSKRGRVWYTCTCALSCFWGLISCHLSIVSCHSHSRHVAWFAYYVYDYHIMTLHYVYACIACVWAVKSLGCVWRSGTLQRVWARPLW